MNNILDCIALHNNIKEEVKEELKRLNVLPLLIIVSVGENQSNKRYANQIIKLCNSVGIRARHISLTRYTTESDLIKVIKEYQKFATGVMVQFPIDSIHKISKSEILRIIDPLKDIDGLTDFNIGLLHTQNSKALTPATPSGVMEIIDSLNYNLVGKNVLILGRSMLVGRPIAEMMLQRDATVMMVHSKTSPKVIKDNIRGIEGEKFDVIISAIGKPKFIKHAKADIIIDVGINECNGKIVGDVDLETCLYQWATCVPKGVGVVTTAYLLKNMLKAYYLQNPSL